MANRLKDPGKQHPPSAVPTEELDLTIVVYAHDHQPWRYHTGMMRFLLECPRTWVGFLTIFHNS